MVLVACLHFASCIGRVAMGAPAFVFLKGRALVAASGSLAAILPGSARSRGAY